MSLTTSDFEWPPCPNCGLYGCTGQGIGPCLTVVRPVETGPLAAEADAIADLVNQVTVRRIDPERFHQQRDEIAKRLRALASRLRGNVRRRPSTTWRSEKHARPA